MPRRTDVFDPTDTALHARLSAINVAAYSKSRNHLNGQVTRLSPYITHGLVTIPELFERLPKLKLSDKLAFDFGWREFLHHVWSRESDLTSNHLSWQWAASTFSSKPYLFNTENVARYAPADWHCVGSVVDTSYEDLERIARSNETVAVSTSLFGTRQPELFAAPPGLPSASIPKEERIRLVHPWMLADRPFDGLRLGMIHLPFHAKFRWSGLRWRFVMDRMSAITDALFIGDLNELNTMLSEAPHIESTETLNPGYREALPARCTQLADAPRRFANPVKTCRSFSAFWAQCAGEQHERGWHR